MFVLTVLLLSTALSTLSCNSNEVYMKITKKSGGSWASEEFVDIYSGSTLLYTTPTLANSEERTIEQCLTAAANNQYTIKLRDTYGDSWTAGSYVMVEGPYSNRVFKNFLAASSQESYPLSLYMPIIQTDVWKMTSGSVSGDWTQYNFGESGWTQVTLGSVATQSSGTQYFRKQFVGLTGMAAYELSMKYRYGIVAYINGAEIYRDNMPDGTPSGSTTATGSYTSTEFHAIIRPGTEVANSQSVLAIEVHFLTTGSFIVDFDAYLAILARSVREENDPCFIYPYTSTVSSSAGTNVNYLNDWQRSTAYYTSTYPSYVTYTFSGPSAFVNGYRVWPYTSYSSAPTAYTLQGANSASASSWTNVVVATGMTFESSEYQTVIGYFNTALFSHYRLQVNTASTTTTYMYEGQPVICAVNPPTTIEFEQQTYSFYARYESVSVKPKVSEFTNCIINPTPAEGLTFDTATCTLSGVVVNPATTSYTLTSTINGQQYTGSFTLQITSCAGTVITANRVYSTNAVYETFVLRDSSNNVVLQVTSNSGQINNSEVNHIVCLTSTANYELTVASSYNYWMSTSFLYINAMFDGLTDYETILRARLDNNLGLPNVYDFNANYAIKPYENWYYKPADPSGTWYNSETSGWNQYSAPNYPQSTNQIQLYKKQFTVSSVENAAGLVVSLKYRYGVIIYLNSHEVFRKGFTGDLTTSTISTTALSDVNYREISLPIKSIGNGTVTSVDYVTTGQNTIAIGLIGATQAATDSTFDCAVRLMGISSTSRVWKTSYGYSGMSGYPSTIMNFYYGYSLYYTSCSSNYYQITFDDDRHEWISSVVFKLYYTQGDQHPRNVIIKAKNAEDSTWTVLKEVSGMTWSVAGQSNRIWLPNSNSYNMYRFENFATGDASSCSWKIGQIDLRSDATAMSIPALSYDSTIEIYKDIEMGEVYASSTYYTDFTVNPPLPTGVNLDPYTGTISGTATASTTAQTYIVSAKKFNTGETVTAQFSLSVAICTGGRSLITGVARIDGYPSETSYKLYQGKGTTGTIISEGGFTLASNLNYVDSCLQNGIYTFEFRDTLTDGWFVPGGYYLSVDVGELKFEMGQVYTGVSPTSVTTMFSSYLPFQVEYDDWKVYKNVDEISSDWNTINFDDSTWTVTKAAQIGTSEAITVYIRRDITLDDVNNYNMLNVRMKYAGGVVCYFNGRKVARFNLEEGFDADTESIEVHDSTAFSKFHIVLATVGAVTGKNVIAFEIHRPNGQSSAEAIVFDATGVFGVNDCSLGVDSVINVSGTTAYTIGNLENFFDYTPATYGYQTNAAGTYLQWTVENLEGSKFNSYAIETEYNYSGWGISLYGRSEESLEEDPRAEEYTSMFSKTGITTLVRGRLAFDVPVGIAGFRQFRHEVDVAASSAIYASAYIFQYCKPSGTGFCEGIDDYPAVGEGQISPSSCPYGYRGYSYRECTNGQLGSINNDKCTYKIPSRITYGSNRFTLVMNTQTNINAPRYVNLITKFYLAENTFLPDGLELDATTGAITGVPTSESGLKTYTIYGENPSGVAYTTINMSVRKGECKAEGNFPKTNVGEIAEYQCSLAGSYVGTQKRACILGAKDGEWQKIQGTCMSIPMLVILVIIVIVIIVVVVFFFMRTTKKAKAVGGVKGKKSTKSGKSASKKAMDKKASAKSVKV